MNFQNRLLKNTDVCTWASTKKTAEILKITERSLYSYRTQKHRNSLIENVHYKRDKNTPRSAVKYNLEKTCKRIHYVDLNIFTDPNYNRMDHFDDICKEVNKYYPEILNPKYKLYFNNRLIDTWEETENAAEILKITKGELLLWSETLLTEGKHYKKVKKYFTTQIKYNLHETCKRIHKVELHEFLDKRS